jgi:diguanylate cyclase (GGDEF)-like protein/PAS domain S-box-containing protein
MKSMDRNPSNAFPTKVLLVEDNPGDASLVMSALNEPSGLFEVQWVLSLEAAAPELLKSHYECLLVDLGLPDGDGLDVVDTLRRSATDSALVILSSRTDEELGVHAIQHGADDYFLKSELSARGLQRTINYAIERTRSKVTLERLSARSGAVMASLGDALVVFDCDGLVVSTNPAWDKIVGVASNEMIGLRISEFPCTYLYRDGTPVAESDLATNQTLDRGLPIRGAIRGVRRADGGISWVEVNTHPLRSADDRMDGVVASIRDVTERLAAREAAVFQAALLGAVGQAVIATDSQGLIVYWNKAAVDLYGWSETEALHRRISELILSESPETVGELIQASVEGTGWTGDLLVHRRDGTIFPALITQTPMFDEHGELKALIGVSTDISERKRAEEAAQELSVIVESSADAILTLALDGTILTWNRGAEGLYGYSAEEAIGENSSLLDSEAAAETRLSSMTVITAGKPVQDLELVRRRRDGSLVDVSLSGSPIYGDDGNVVGIASIGRDIGDRKRLEEELSRQAVHDSLTGLPNRTLLVDRLSQALAGAARRNASVSVLFLDLDQFKSVNDTYGHLVGDDLLVEVAERLRTAIRPSDTLARFGGDEFVVVCEDADAVEAEGVAERLGAALKDPFEIAGSLQYISASIGIAVTPPLEADPDALLRYADTAMYDAKARGRARTRIFDASLATAAKDRQELTNDLGTALRENALEVHYQPVIELATGRVVGMEALTRWHHPVRGWIPPTIFVPLAEENGLIVDFDYWVLNRACRDGAELRAIGLLPPDALLSVNISARNVGDLGLVDAVREAAATTTFPLEALELEVTETAIMAEVPTIRLVLEGIRELGVGIALDDFGTGYSSLTFVRQLPATTIKIDRSFTRHITEGREDLAICATVIDLARAVGLRTIAEGVETREQMSVLHRLGCDAGQGYLWSSALPLEDLASRLRCEPQEFAFAAKAPRWRSGDLQGPVRSMQMPRRKPAKIA